MLGWGTGGIMAETVDWLFWFIGGTADHGALSAASMDEAKRKIADLGLTYDECGSVRGPDDGWPPGIWRRLDAVT
jgi:hypothetical protein